MGKTVTYECDGCKAGVDEKLRTKETTRLEGPNFDSYKVRDLCEKCADKANAKGFVPTKHREKKEETATVTPITTEAEAVAS